MTKWIVMIAVLLIVALTFFLQSDTLPVYHYESSDRGLRESEVPWKGRTLEDVEARFEAYKKEKGDDSLHLCITDRRDWFNVWHLKDNLMNRRWEYPYMTPSKDRRQE